VKGHVMLTTTEAADAFGVAVLNLTRLLGASRLTYRMAGDQQRSV
jgi:hypothetical protein